MQRFNSLVQINYNWLLSILHIHKQEHVSKQMNGADIYTLKL